ncbi:DUF222 domain-containing protein [Isoptericola sp. b490]|nr:DUF222 domain-containing protein [Isoptericola sp. b490]
MHVTSEAPPFLGSGRVPDGADAVACGGAEWTTELLAGAVPGAALVDLLERGDPEQASDEALLEAAVDYQKIVSWAQAGAARAAAELSRREVMNPVWPSAAGAVSVTDVTAEELAPALGWSRRAARRLVTDGRAFDGPLAATGEMLARGELDLPRARVLVDALVEQPLPVAWEVQDMVLPDAPCRTVSQLTRDVAQALVVVDPRGASQNCRLAERRRRVDRPKALPDGMAGWWAVLPAAEATRMDATLDSLARSGRAAGDPRTLDQLRADLLADLVIGRIEGPGVAGRGPASRAAETTVPEWVHAGPGRPGDAPASPGESDHSGVTGPGRTVRRQAARARIDVLVPWDVLAGISDGPGFLAGYGPIPAPVARELASDATWRRILTDARSGAVLDVGRMRYRPPAALAEHVRCRDRWCVRPGCSAAASRCDLDHTAEWDRDDGPTAHDNLGPLCRRDHQVKTHGGARLRQVAPGVFEWTTPLGRTYRVVPGRDEAYRRIDGHGVAGRGAQGTAEAAADAGIRDDARVNDDAGVRDDARVNHDAGVRDDARVRDDATVRDDAGVHDATGDGDEGGASPPF